MKKNELFIILLLLIFILPAVFPLTHHGFFQTDDGEWMIIRLSAFYQALHDGQFPVRFLQRLNFGFGYPVAEFLYPGSFYFGTLLHIIRFGFVNSVKIIFGVSLIGSAVFSYFWLSRLFSRISSFTGALFAVYLPYHLYDVYYRGSMGEIFALMWVPFIFWQIERKSLLYSSLGIAILILSHNTLAALFMPLIICYMLHEIYLNKQRLEAVYFYSSVLLFGFGLSSFFWLPIIFELQNTVFSTTVVSQWNLYFSTFTQIGIVSYLVLLAVTVLLISKKADVKKHRFTYILFAFTVLSLFMATNISYTAWQLLPAKFVQFPFRFLSIIAVTIPFLAAFIVSTQKGKHQWTTIVVLVLLLVYSALPYSKPISYFDKGEGYYYTNDATTTVQDEYMPVWVKQKPLKHTDQLVEIINSSGKVRNIAQTNKKLIFTTNVIKQSSVMVNTIYWPGWKATIDGVSTKISYNNPQGVMVVSVPNGMHTITFSFGESPIRLFSVFLSIFSFIIVIFFSTRLFSKK